jgi:hypothetical protein
MKRFKNISRTKKIIAAGATVALTLGLAGTAFAFFTASGTGTGSAPVGSAATFTLTQDGLATACGSSTDPALYPDAKSGLATGPAYSTGMNLAGTYVDCIVVTVANTSSSSQYLTALQAAVSPAFYSQTNTALPACTPADFSLANQTDSINQLQGQPATDAEGFNFSPNNTATGFATFMIEMIDNGANQDNCQGVTVPLVFSAS